jgi:hypothetical protein
MPQREDYRGRGPERDRERDDRRRRQEDERNHRFGEGRSFARPASYEVDRRDYGHSQEYGIEARDNAGDDFGYGSRRSQWRPDGGAPYGDLEFESRDRGFQQYGPPADYAYHPHAGHEFDPEYLQWRDEQMRNHDRDYREWRRAQHEKYDNDYRAFRGERLEHFDRRFKSWRDSRSPVGGMADTTVAPGVSGYGDKTVNSGNESRQHKTYAAPHDPPAEPRAPGAPAPSPEFGRESPIVRATTDGKSVADERKDEGDR